VPAALPNPKDGNPPQRDEAILTPTNRWKWVSTLVWIAVLTIVLVVVRVVRGW